MQIKNIKFSKYLFLLIAFLCANFLIVNFANASIIFEDNFDNSANWNSAESATGTSPGTIGTDSHPFNLPVPDGWSDYRSTRGLLPATFGYNPTIFDNGLPTFQVTSSVARGGSGKSLRCNYEMANDWVGGALGKYLGSTGYDELYIRFYKMFQAGWKYRTASGGVIHKWFRLMSNVDDPASSTGTDPQDMYKAPSGRPDWLTNCAPNYNSSNQCGKQAYIMIRDTHGSNVTTNQLAYNPEGHAGTTQNDSYVNFDGNASFNWKDYHGTLVTGNAGDFPWSSGYSSTAPSTDYQGNGQWVQYEIHAKMNDIGSSNGLVEIYLNGTKVAQVSNLTLRTNDATKFNFLMIPDNMDNEVFLVRGNTTTGSNVITNLTPVSALGIATGMDVSDINAAFPTGTTITAIDDTAHTMTVSNNATKTVTGDGVNTALQPPPAGEQYFAIDDLDVYTPLTSNDSLWSSSPQDGRLPLNYSIASQSYNSSDFISLLSNWFKAGTASDFNIDGSVNTRDLGIMMSKWN